MGCLKPSLDCGLGGGSRNDRLDEDLEKGLICERS